MIFSFDKLQSWKKIFSRGYVQRIQTSNSTLFRQSSTDKITTRNLQCSIAERITCSVHLSFSPQDRLRVVVCSSKYVHGRDSRARITAITCSDETSEERCSSPNRSTPRILLISQPRYVSVRLMFNSKETNLFTNFVIKWYWQTPQSPSCQPNITRVIRNVYIVQFCQHRYETPLSSIFETSLGTTNEISRFLT